MISVVIPNWNGRRWLPGLPGGPGGAGAARRTRSSWSTTARSDGSVEYLRDEHPAVTGPRALGQHGLRPRRQRRLARGRRRVRGPDQRRRRAGPRLAGADRGRAGRPPEAASVACKMLSLRDPQIVDDAGDVLRRDGVCEQRGRFGPDDGRWDAPGEVFGACAGAALYRRAAVRGAGGFHEPLLRLPRGRRPRPAPAPGRVDLPLRARRSRSTPPRAPRTRCPVGRRSWPRATPWSWWPGSGRPAGSGPSCTASSGGRGTRRGSGGCGLMCGRWPPRSRCSRPRCGGAGTCARARSSRSTSRCRRVRGGAPANVNDRLRKGSEWAAGPGVGAAT